MVYVILAIAVIIILWVISAFNFFVSAKARIKASIQEIGNQLKRQAELIPNLEASTKGYLKHEKGIFDDLAEARKAISAAVKSGSLQEMTKASSKLSDILPTMRIAVESNPEIKGSGVVIDLMEELRDTADKVMYSRRLLIDLTQEYNIKRAIFPTSLLANAFHFEELPGLITPEEGEHLKVSQEGIKTPKVDL